MTQYYLHFTDRNGHSRDNDGFEARDDNMARQLTRRAVGQIVADEIDKGADEVSFTLCLDNEQGVRLATIPISAAIGMHLGA